MRWLLLGLLVMMQGCCSRSPGTLAIKDTVESGIDKHSGYSLHNRDSDYVEFSPSGTLMATIQNRIQSPNTRPSILVYEATSWDRVKYDMDFPAIIKQIAFDEEHLLVLVVTADEVLEWDLEAGAYRWIVEADSRKYEQRATEAMLYQGGWSVFFAHGRELRIHPDGSTSYVRAPKDTIEGCEYKDGRVLACQDGLIQIRSQSDKVIRRIWHSKWIAGIDISPDGNRLAAFCPGDLCYFNAARSGVVTVWDLDSGRKLYTFRSDYSDYPEKVNNSAFVSEDSVLIGTDQRILVVDVESGDVTRTFVAEPDTWLGRDGQLLADGMFVSVSSNGVDIYSFSP